MQFSTTVPNQQNNHRLNSIMCNREGKTPAVEEGGVVKLGKEFAVSNLSKSLFWRNLQMTTRYFLRMLTFAVK